MLVGSVGHLAATTLHFVVFGALPDMRVTGGVCDWDGEGGGGGGGLMCAAGLQAGRNLVQVCSVTLESRGRLHL